MEHEIGILAHVILSLQSTASIVYKYNINVNITINSSWNGNMENIPDTETSIVANLGTLVFS